MNRPYGDRFTQIPVSDGRGTPPDGMADATRASVSHQRLQNLPTP
jgi:hypothetical protein